MTETTDIRQSSGDIPPPNASKRQMHILRSLRAHKFLVCAIFSLLTGVGASVIISLPPIYSAGSCLRGVA